MYFLPKSLSSIHPTQTTSLPVANVVKDQIYRFPVIIPRQKKVLNVIEREKGLKAKYEHNMRKKFKYITKTRKMSEKQPCLWKDLQKLGFKN